MLNIIDKHKIFIAHNIIKNKKCFIKGAYIKEMQHCNLIIEIFVKKCLQVLTIKFFSNIFMNKKGKCYVLFYVFLNMYFSWVH